MISGRRAALVAVTLFNYGPVRNSVMALVTVVIVLIHLWQQPYRVKVFNQLESASLLCHMLCLHPRHLLTQPRYVCINGSLPLALLALIAVYPGAINR
jgi:hypothetical protein